MKLTKQKENIEQLLQLISENPDLPILPMVAAECVTDDSFGYWGAKWGSAEVIKYYCPDEKIYFYDDFDDLVEEWIDNNYEDYENLPDKELELMAKRIVNNYEWIDAIIVYISHA